MAFARSRQALAIAGVLGLALGASACGTGNDKKSDSASKPECAAYEKYQALRGAALLLEQAGAFGPEPGGRGHELDRQDRDLP